MRPPNTNRTTRVKETSSLNRSLFLFALTSRGYTQGEGKRTRQKGLEKKNKQTKKQTRTVIH